MVNSEEINQRFSMLLEMDVKPICKYKKCPTANDQPVEDQGGFSSTKPIFQPGDGNQPQPRCASSYHTPDRIAYSLADCGAD